MWNDGVACQRVVIPFLCPYQVAPNKPLFLHLPGCGCDSDMKWVTLPCYFGDGHKPLAYLSHPLVSASRRLSICLPLLRRNPTCWKQARKEKERLFFYIVIATVRAVWRRVQLACFVWASPSACRWGEGWLRSSCRWRPAGCRCPFGSEHPNTWGVALTGSDLCYSLRICPWIIYTQQVSPFCSPHLCISSSPSLHLSTPLAFCPSISAPPSRSLKSHQHVLVVFLFFFLAVFSL